MKTNKIVSVIALTAAMLLTVVSGSQAQIGEIWSVESGADRFLGSANMDGDPNEELVYFWYSTRIIIYDGVTGNIDWDSGALSSIYIAGLFGAINGFSPFCDINNDGIKEITFAGKENSGDPYSIYVVGFNGAGIAGSGGGGVPGIYVLSQNYPNPFNPSTTIKYTTTASGQVDIKIYNSLGQEVRKLVSEYKSAGEYSINWDGKGDSGISLASGTYFYQMHAGDFVSTKKTILLK